MNKKQITKLIFTALVNFAIGLDLSASNLPGFIFKSPSLSSNEHGGYKLTNLKEQFQKNQPAASTIAATVAFDLASINNTPLQQFVTNLEHRTYLPVSQNVVVKSSTTSGKINDESIDLYVERICSNPTIIPGGCNVFQLTVFDGLNTATTNVPPMIWLISNLS